MSFIDAFILGLIQGITEFLPISSSGHLYLAETFLLHTQPNLPLEVFLHMATLIAVVAVFWKHIFLLLNGLFTKESSKEKIYALQLILSTAVTFPIAFILKPIVEMDMNPLLVGATLLITGVAVLYTSLLQKKEEKYRSFSWKMAIFLGVVQALAVFPGISRSGITLVFLLLMKIEPKKALEISFLLSIPTIAGAGALMIPDMIDSSFDLFPLIVAGVVACISAFIVMTSLKKYFDAIWKYCAYWCFFIAICTFSLAG